MKSEKKKVAFGGIFAIYITVLLTLILAALGFLWHYLSCYEAGRVAVTMDRYMTQTLPSQLQQEIDTYSIACQTGYQSADDVSKILSEKLGGDDWCYREKRQAADGTVIFALYSGEIEVGEATVHPAETDSTRLGFGAWQEPQVTFDLEQFGRTVTIIVPYGCKVYVNGEEVSEDHVSETMGLYPQLEPYEALITTPNQLLVYKIDGTYTEVAVSFSEGYFMYREDLSDCFYAMPVCEDAMAEELIEFCKQFVKDHTEFTYNKVALWAVQRHIVPDCALYRELTESSAGMKWGHGIHAKIETLDVKNFKYYGNVITCDASYSMKTDEGDRSETMRILLVETVLGWRVIHREIM